MFTCSPDQHTHAHAHTSSNILRKAEHMSTFPYICVHMQTHGNESRPSYTFLEYRHGHYSITETQRVSSWMMNHLFSPTYQSQGAPWTGQPSICTHIHTYRPLESPINHQLTNCMTLDCEREPGKKPHRHMGEHADSTHRNTARWWI